ncbi:TIGR03862 family flavoprotein [Rhizobacter sp. SG703]|uniref:TIGR03862 family flavoprotein n=1 Tax=Rhizobacter sp. SG703 TaxID=2587140 RepID=UPI00144764EC|nr:TIGR03862 family flavoprotein [Rhizobacter sp. SG703]NKI95991.1 hypothetical protein [Rhizobacter sp. SG703]
MPAIAPASNVVIVGGGPAGLMAAERLAAGGVQVDLYDAMPSVGRKFLLAGKGGLNLTHSEPLPAFVGRYGAQREQVAGWLDAFGPQQLREWVGALGIDTFVGSSGRVFPTDMKAAPLLRAWLQRLRAAGVRFHMRQRWLGWADDGTLRFASPTGEHGVRADAVLLALGGASWSRLGSDGAWVPWLAQRAVDVAPLRPSNCGFDVTPGWSAHFSSRFAGEPLKSVAIALDDGWRQAGEFVVTQTGVEGSLVYAASARLRDGIEAAGQASFALDLLPARTLDWVAAELAHPRGPRSLSTHLKSRLGLHGVKASLLHELVPKPDLADPQRLAAHIKGLRIAVGATRPIDEAISSAGGVRAAALDGALMLRAVPGVFVAGEMLDWEAPTGGYLLTATLASARVAAQGALDWLANARPASAGV